MNLKLLNNKGCQNDLQDIKHQIFHAKSNELLKDFPSECIDLVVTSPPYDDLRDYGGVVSWNFDVFKEIAKAKVAQLMNREWVLIEAVEEYCKIAKERIENI